MDKKPSNLGLNNGLPKSELTGEEELALWHENGKNRPVTRQSLASQILSSQKEIESQLPKKGESNNTD
jgi:hypothetical protein